MATTKVSSAQPQCCRGVISAQLGSAAVGVDPAGGGGGGGVFEAEHSGETRTRGSPRVACIVQAGAVAILGFNAFVALGPANGAPCSCNYLVGRTCALYETAEALDVRPADGAGLQWRPTVSGVNTLAGHSSGAAVPTARRSYRQHRSSFCHLYTGTPERPGRPLHLMFDYPASILDGCHKSFKTVFAAWIRRTRT